MKRKHPNKVRPSQQYGTIQCFKRRSWNSMNSRCSTKESSQFSYRNIKVLMTKVEFYNFCDQNKEIILDLFHRKQKPSINRIDPDGHYELGNIEILELSKNQSLARRHKKPIIGRNDITGDLLYIDGCKDKKTIEFGFNPISIQKICKKIKNRGYSHKGYSWAYLEDYEKNGDAAFRLEKKRHIRRDPV